MPADTDTLAVNDDMLTGSGLVTALCDGSSNSNEVLKTITALAVGNTRFAAQVAAQRAVSYGTAAANTITPTIIGQVYVKTDTSDVYVSKGLTSADWVEVSN